MASESKAIDYSWVSCVELSCSIYLSDELLCQCRWLVVAIYLAASHLVKCVPLATSASVNNCYISLG